MDDTIYSKLKEVGFSISEYVNYDEAMARDKLHGYRRYVIASALIRIADKEFERQGKLFTPDEIAEMIVRRYGGTIEEAIVAWVANT